MEEKKQYNKPRLSYVELGHYELANDIKNRLLSLMRRLELGKNLSRQDYTSLKMMDVLSQQLDK